VGWPEDLLTTHPPICLPCVGKARAQCPHMWKGGVAVRVRRSEECAAYGHRYTYGRLGPLLADSGVVMFVSPLVRWTMAAQLVRALVGCTIVSFDDELKSGAVSREIARR
jgi:hypothetical protein